MRRPYAAPRIVEPVPIQPGAAAHRAAATTWSPGRFVAEFVAQAKTSRLAFRRHQYEVESGYHIPDGEPFPDFDTWLEVKESAPRACLQCGCNGQRGSFHGGGDGD